MKKLREGFTLIELSISMLFIALLSLSVVVVIHNAIQAYQRGLTLTRVDNTGNNLVDDMRNSIQNSISRTELGKNISITKTGALIINDTEQNDVPLYGAFCTGDYTYVWNSGYFFSDDAEFTDPKQAEHYAKVKFGDQQLGDGEIFRLIKIKDQERSICLSALYDDDGVTKVDTDPLHNEFTLKLPENETISEPITILSESGNNDLAIYDLSVTIPATNASETLSLYAVSFILGTTTGGVNITTSGDSCSVPVGEINFNNNCAINKFSFVAQSDATDVNQSEIDYVPEEIPDPPSPFESQHKIIYQPNCDTNKSLIPKVYTFKTSTITVEDNSFSCPYYKFAGYWNTAADNSGTQHRPNATITVNDDDNNIVLYAQWQREKAKITYRPNGGTPNTNIEHAPVPDKGTNVSLYGSNTFSRSYFSLTGWKEKSTNKVYQPSSNYFVTSDTIFDANWTRDIYTINYIRGCDFTNTATDQVYAGNNYTIKSNLTAQSGVQWTCPNKDFKGWSTTKNGPVNAGYNPGATIKPTQKGTLNLYAVWETKTYICTKQYRLQNADGSYPSNYTFDSNESIQHGGTCSYTKTVTDYNNNSALTTTATNVTENVTLSLDFPRNIYTLTVLAGTNTSNPTGSGKYRWGQTATVGVTKAASTTCDSYSAPSWSVANGVAGSFNSTSGNSVGYVMGKGNSTVTASSVASSIKQTLTFKTVNANNIIFNGTTYNNNGSTQVNCGNYSIKEGNYPSGYKFSKWSATAGSFANSNYAQTTYTVNGPATITLTGAKNQVVITYIGNGGKTSSNATSTTQTVNVGVATNLTANPFSYANHTFTGWNTAQNGTGTSYSNQQSVTLSNNLTLYAQWKENAPQTPPCPSGFEEWTPGLCWRTFDQSGLFNQSGAKNSCSSNGWRLPTASEYQKLVDTYCDSAYAGGTWYCTANTVTPKGFGYNGARLKEPSSKCDTLKSQCETYNQQQLSGCQHFLTEMKQCDILPDPSSCRAIYQNGYNSCASSASQKNCSSVYSECMSGLSDTTVYLGSKGGYWASESSYVMVLQKDGSDSSVIVGKDKWNVSTNTSDTYLSTRCVVNKK